jgi:hypothetical protein
MPPLLVRQCLCLLFASCLPRQLVVALPLIVPPPPLVVPLSLVYLTHGSCLCLSLEPPPLVVSASHHQQAPHVASASCCQPAPPLVTFISCQPPIVSQGLSSSAGRLIVTSMRQEPHLTKCHCPCSHRCCHHPCLRCHGSHCCCHYPHCQCCHHHCRIANNVALNSTVALSPSQHLPQPLPLSSLLPPLSPLLSSPPSPRHPRPCIRCQHFSAYDLVSTHTKHNKMM